MSATADGINPQGKPYRILVADDVSKDVAQIRSILESQSYKIESVFENGKDLVQWIKDHPAGADVVVLDIIMPILDGFAAFYEIRKLEKPPKVIFLSVENSAAIVRKLIEDGAADFIVKPVKRDTLLEQMRRVLHGAAAR